MMMRLHKTFVTQTLLRFGIKYKSFLPSLCATFKTIIACILLCCALPINSAFAQEQGFRWGKWSAGQTINGGLKDEVVDSYIDSVGNTYIFGRCGLSARLGENGPYINPMDSDSITGYYIGNTFGVFLAKIDTLGNVLWCRSARGATSNSPSIPWNNIVVKDNKITIAFDSHWGSGPRTWLYFFDTIITTSSDMFTIGKDATYFVTFDLDGNRLDYHSVKLYAYDSWDFIYFLPLPFGHLNGSYGNFLVDEDDNIHIFTSGSFFGEDSLHKAYIIVDGDTNRKYLLNIKTQNGKTFATSMYFKMDSNWNLISSRFLIDSITVWNPDGRARAYIEFKESTIAGDEIYASCIFHNEDFYFDPDTLPVRVYLDSVHYLRIDNTCDWQDMPCLLKLNMDGEVVWVQQLYNEYTRTPPTNYLNVGGLAVDENNAYALYCLGNGYDTRFYIDSSHNTLIPQGPTEYCLIVSYNRNTGTPVDYYVVDTINYHSSDNSLATIGDELVLNVAYERLNHALKETEICKINKYTKEVTHSSIIDYNFIVQSKSMSVNDHGWVFRGEIGDQPRVYDSIFLGNYQEASIMTFFYDSTLDLHRQRPCYGVDSLWCDRTAGYTVTLSWRSQFGHSGYELAYVPESGNWDDATVIETTDTTLAVTLLDNQCHLFRVRGLCDGNRAAHSPWSDVITVCPQVGISEVDGYCAFSLYPNPATNMVRVESKKHKLINDEILLIEVFSMNGQKVLTQETSSQFDVSRLSNGTYIVKVVTTSNDYEYLKLIKQ